MPIYRPCLANTLAGSEMGAGSGMRILSQHLGQDLGRGSASIARKSDAHGPMPRRSNGHGDASPIGAEPPRTVAVRSAEHMALVCAHTVSAGGPHDRVSVPGFPAVHSPTCRTPPPDTVLGLEVCPPCRPAIPAVARRQTGESSCNR